MHALEQGNRRVPDLLRARDVLTIIVFLASLLVTYQLWSDASRSATETVQNAFDYRVRDLSDRIRQRLLLYEQVLRATKGLFMANGNVDRKSFGAFAEALHLAETYPGIQGLGYAMIIRPQDLARHIESVRSEGFANYTVRPEGERDLYTSIIFLEPFQGKNLRAFGFDMYSDAMRRKAMDAARDTGEATLTGKVRLVQEAGNEVQSGFLMYLPIFRYGMSHETPEQRHERVVGWVYAPFRMDDFMHGLSEQLDGDIDVEIYDMYELSDEARMYDSNRNIRAVATQHRFRSVVRVVAANHAWTIAIAALPTFEKHTESGRALLILQAGISISLLLALLMWIFLDDRARAVRAANQALQLALYDTLTGLPNRKLLDERMQQALAIARRNGKLSALLFIDLDRFKPVNDNFGHAYGDLLLKEVAHRLLTCMRQSDTASRLGGDEFVALLTEVDHEQDAMVVAKKILNALTRPYEIAGHTFNISASIGAALYPRDGRDGKELTRSADLAMYEAKNSGRGTVRFARIETAEKES